MKVNEFVEKAKKEFKTEEEQKVVDAVKASLKAVSDCKKTLRALEKAHATLLESDVDDLELDSHEY